MSEINPIFSSINYKKIFWALVVIIGIFMPILSFDYGLTEDSEIHNKHGKSILDYFAGKDTLAAYGTLNESGDLPEQVDINDERNCIRQMNTAFGGFFDFLTAFLHQYFGFIGEYEFRNLINSLFGVLLFLFTGLLAKELGGWKTAVLALLFIVLTPVLFGHSMNNPKDIPFAAFYMFSLFHLVKLVKELPMVKPRRAAFLIINISLLINIRLIGLIMIPLLFLAVFSWWILNEYRNKFKKIDLGKTAILVFKITGIAFMAYLSVCIFWPFVQSNPLELPLFLFLNTSKIAFFNNWQTIQLFEGKWISNLDIPWYYIPKSLFIITIPLHLFMGMFFIILLFFKKRLNPSSSVSLLLVLFILFVSLFPIISAVIADSPDYDLGRHFLFTIPPMISLCALSWKNLFDLAVKKITRYILYVVLALLLCQPFFWMVKNHPLESLYFSPLVGGPNAAFKNYEMDYWGFAVKPAVDWIEKNAENATSTNPARVRIYYGNQLKVSYFIEKIPHLKYVMTTFASPDWDYSIFMYSETKHNPSLIDHWPPENTVYQVKVDTVTVCAVVKNVYKSEVINTDAMELAAAANPTPEGYIQLSLAYFNAANYIKCIEASEKVLSLAPVNYVAYNNICAAYNCLMMYDEAKLAGENALKLSPDNELTKNNLKISNNGITLKKEKKFTVEQYITLSVNYYKMSNFKASISACRELLKIDPTNAVAYNNICACENNLGNFVDAKNACEQALKNKPDFDLAKNNLKVALDSIKSKKK